MNRSITRVKPGSCCTDETRIAARRKRNPALRLKISFLQSGGSAISRSAQNQGFTCENCGTNVSPLSNGSYRNHCPACLWSKHVDHKPGDRAAECRKLMIPERIDHRRHKGLVIIHRCTACGFVRPNRVAEDLYQGDDIDTLAALMRQMS
ncbi:RNHCP domain-containing protein [Streptomyces sp. NPDC001739]